MIPLKLSVNLKSPKDKEKSNKSPKKAGTPRTVQEKGGRIKSPKRGSTTRVRKENKNNMQSTKSSNRFNFTALKIKSKSPKQAADEPKKSGKIAPKKISWFT